MLGLLAPIFIPLERPSKCPWIRGPQYRGYHDSRFMRTARGLCIAVQIPSAMFQQLSRWPTEPRSLSASKFHGLLTVCCRRIVRRALCRPSLLGVIVDWKISMMGRNRAIKREVTKRPLRCNCWCYLGLSRPGWKEKKSPSVARGPQCCRDACWKILNSRKT